jgi:hypothetical protein
MLRHSERLLRVLRVYLAARLEFTRRTYRSTDGVRAAITIDTDAVAAQFRFAESRAISVCLLMATGSRSPTVDPPTRWPRNFNCGRLTKSAFDYRSSFDLQLQSVNSCCRFLHRIAQPCGNTQVRQRRANDCERPKSLLLHLVRRRSFAGTISNPNMARSSCRLPCCGGSIAC